MVKILQVVLIIVVCLGCKKSNDSIIPDIIGAWDFEVSYSELNTKETIYSYVGDFVMNEKMILIHHCITDCIEVEITENGSIYSKKNVLIGVVKDDVCSIAITNGYEDSFSKVKINGKRILD